MKILIKKRKIRCRWRCFYFLRNGLLKIRINNLFGTHWKCCQRHQIDFFLLFHHFGPNKKINPLMRLSIVAYSLTDLLTLSLLLSFSLSVHLSLAFFHRITFVLFHFLRCSLPMEREEMQISSKQSTITNDRDDKQQ